MASLRADVVDPDVMPAKATQKRASRLGRTVRRLWIPAFAGMTLSDRLDFKAAH